MQPSPISGPVRPTARVRPLPMQPALAIVRANAFDCLTQREHEVLQVLATGATNAQIAGMLELSEGTIRNSIARITCKLGVADRTQAALLAYRAGLGVTRDITPVAAP